MLSQILPIVIVGGFYFFYEEEAVQQAFSDKVQRLDQKHLSQQWNTMSMILAKKQKS